MARPRVTTGTLVAQLAREVPLWQRKGRWVAGVRSDWEGWKFAVLGIVYYSKDGQRLHFCLFERRFLLGIWSFFTIHGVVMGAVIWNDLYAQVQQHLNTSAYSGGSITAHLSCSRSPR